MRVKITYGDITGEELEALLEDANVEKVEILSEHNLTVDAWLEDHNINGHAVSYAHQQFCKDNPTQDLSMIKFSKAVKATGKYTTKNIRIGDGVQRCFVARDGHEI